MAGGVVTIPKSWRSEALSAIAFTLLCPVAYLLTLTFPSTIITGPLFDLFGVRINLSLPLAIFLPLGALSQGMYRIYNVKYALDPRGLEARHGVLSMSQVAVRIRYEDIRAIEVRQSVLDRLLDIGKVEISTAASSDTEIIMSGIAAPYHFRQVVQLERDKRQSVSRKDRGEELP
mgnify:FL=1